MVFKKIGLLILLLGSFTVNSNQWLYESFDGTKVVVKENANGYIVKYLGSDSSSKSLGKADNNNVKLFSNILNVNFDEKKLINNKIEWKGIFNEEYRVSKIGNTEIKNIKYEHLFKLNVQWANKGEYIVYYDLTYGIVAFQKVIPSMNGSFFILKNLYGFPKLLYKNDIKKIGIPKLSEVRTN